MGFNRGLAKKKWNYKQNKKGGEGLNARYEMGEEY